jgi:shikimate dehydrogenase
VAVEVKRVGVIGDPVEHSFSPVFQQAAFDAIGYPARYERWHTPAAELPDRIAGLRLPDALGANVTVPHKIAVRELVDSVSETARKVGAVNTVINQDGRLHGDNTDVYGFQRSLLTARPAAERDRVLVIGAGGAARAIVLALAEAGVAGVTIANRTPERAEMMANELGVAASVVPLTDWDLLAAIRDHSVIVNATSIGWNDESEVVPGAILDEVDPSGLVVDLTYRDTPLLLDARARGLATLDGLLMLVYQGARSFELWTGVSAPMELMMRAAEDARRG